MLPSFFVCHGAPNLAIEQNEYSRFLKELAQTISKPQAIVIFTAHWESAILSITETDDTYETVYDFGSLWPELFSIKYPAQGSRHIAAMVKDVFEKNGIPTQGDKERGLDHGSWVVLRLMYPEANIPVIQISVNPKLPLADQYKIGQSLSELREKEILVIGSGGTVHNLGTIDWEGEKGTKEWPVQFDDWLIDKVEKWDVDSLYTYESLAPHARLAVPRNEHLVPLFIAMGSGDNQRKAKLLHRSYAFGTLSHICFQF
jgi:4,5-DOPA dioxygenase extradiol